jgi:hypothetical protein
VVIVLTPTTTLMEGFTNHLVGRNYSHHCRELQTWQGQFKKAFCAKAQIRKKEFKVFVCVFAPLREKTSF